MKAFDESAEKQFQRAGLILLFVGEAAPRGRSLTSVNALMGEGRLASDEELGAALEECEQANSGAPITLFEITTAAALRV